MSAARTGVPIIAATAANPIAPFPMDRPSSNISPETLVVTDRFKVASDGRATAALNHNDRNKTSSSALLPARHSPIAKLQSTTQLNGDPIKSESPSTRRSTRLVV